MRIFQLLFLVFLLVPIAEIYVLIKVGGVIGALPTVFLVVFTAVLGAVLLRQQGFYTLRRVRRTLEDGGLPAVPMVEGVFLIVAGALLLTPGFVTDTIGFALLIPPVRRSLAKALIERGLTEAMHGPRRRRGPAGERRQGPRTIEGEFRRHDD